MPLLPLRFPKLVEIVNPRLSLIYYGTSSIMFLALVARFWMTKAYFREIPITGGVDVAMQVSEDGVNSFLMGDARATFCDSPLEYDYAREDNASGLACAKVMSMMNHSCSRLCEKWEVSTSCLNWLETYTREAVDQLFLATHLQETWLYTQDEAEHAVTHNNQSSKSSHSHHSMRDHAKYHKQYLVPSADSMSVDIAYNYAIPGDRDSWKSGASWRDCWGSGSRAGFLGVESSLVGSSATNIMTVVLDHEGKVSRWVRPGERLQFNVKELLALAGEPGLLDQPQEIFGASRLHVGSNRFKTGPAARISGVDLTLDFRCHNFRWREFDEKHEGPHCYVSVQANSDRWVSAERLDTVGQHGARHRLFHGLRMRAVSSGFLLVLDFNSIYLNIVSCIVLMGLPLRFVLVISTHMLGHLSKIYRRVIYEKFDITEQVGGLATRLMANSAVFVDLQDATDGITKKRMSERLKETLRHQDQKLDDEEVKKMIDFCHRAVVRHKHVNIPGKPALPERKGLKRLRTVRSFAREALNARSRSDLGEEERITIDSFGIACSTNERIGFQALVDLFDRDRPRRPLERFFTPRNIRPVWASLDRGESKADSARLRAETSVSMGSFGSDFGSPGSDDGGVSPVEVADIELGEVTDRTVVGPRPPSPCLKRTGSPMLPGIESRSTSFSQRRSTSERNVTFELPSLLGREGADGSGERTPCSKRWRAEHECPSTPLEKRKHAARQMRREVVEITAREKVRERQLSKSLSAQDALENSVASLAENFDAQWRENQETVELTLAKYQELIGKTTILEASLQDVETGQAHASLEMNGLHTEIDRLKRMLADGHTALHLK
jgi:hypothetical protein